MRRIGVLLLGCLLLFTLAACGGGEGDGDSDSGPSSSSLVDSTLSEAEPSSSELEVMTVEETVEYFKRLSPQVLGLEGKTMDGYEVFHNQASIPVDGIPCLEISVYSVDSESKTNEAVGTYLLARDATALYRLDPVTEEIKQLEF